MQSVAVLTDSSASLPAELVARYAITVVPIWLIDGERQRRDGLDIEAEELYRRLRADRALRISSATPSVGEFLAAYDRLLAEHREIVSVHISGKLTSIVEVARQAAAQRPEATVEVIDSGSASMACGFAVLAAARAAQAGASAAAAAAAAAAIAGRARLVGTLETLRYVEHSGRLKRAGAQAAERLHLRPLISIEAGRVRFLRMERTRRRARQRLLELVEREAGGRPLHAAVIHAGVPDEAAGLAAALAERQDCVELVTSAFTPVLGGHTGPGFLGIAFYPFKEAAERLEAP